MKALTNRILMHLTLIILVSYATFSKPISLEEAKQIAMQHNLQMNKYSIELQDPSAYKLIASSHDIFSKSAENPTFYIYNFPQKGWVIIAGDDIVPPILAYSKEGNYDLENLHDNAKYWLEQYNLTISKAIKQGTPQSEKIANDWLVARNPKKRTSLLDEAVQPLIQTKWRQDSPYNELCPYDEKAKKRALTGCVATALAQIMKYWNFPENGKGKKTYTKPKYGKLYADFENTTYDWENMTNEYDQNSTEKEIKAVATLMYHCGIASSMNYGVEESGAYINDIANSLTTYFMYDTNLRLISYRDYDNDGWTYVLKKNLDNGQPMIYLGSGHAFICDGYDTDGRFHFNLGYGGNLDGYYHRDSITGHGAIIDIKPLELNPQISLLKPLELKQEIVYQNSTVKINANIANNMSESFSGSISLRLFDAENNFLMTIADQKVDNLEPNKPLEITLETNPLFNTSVGKHYIKLYYKRDKLSQWSIASGDNKLEINIQKPLSTESQLSLYSSPILSAYQIDKEKESNLKATASFINTSETNFKGIISASIYDEKGTIIKELANYNVTESIVPNDHIKDIDFSNTISDLDYGIYFIGFMSKYEEEEFVLVNTNDFISFVKFEIVIPELITDPQLKDWIKTNIYKLPEVVANKDGGINKTTANLEALAKIEELDCTNSNLIRIDELISNMPSLKRLKCYNNSLIDLDLIENIELEELHCYENQLNNLNVSKSTKLTKLTCYKNQLNKLDLTSNIKLEELDCRNNQLDTLDISKNIELVLLSCSDNQLTNLDMSNNINLEKLHCSNNQLNDLDVTSSTKLKELSCSNNQLNNLNASKNIELKLLHCSNNQLNSLDVANNIKLYSLNCDNNQLNNLDLSKNIELMYLICYNNQLNNLDLSKNIKLDGLICDNNKLTNLDFTNNIKLTSLSCSENQLTNLDFTNNIKLISLTCVKNQLTNLGVSKNINLTFLLCDDNMLDSLDISPLSSLEELRCCNQAEGFTLYLTNKQKSIFSKLNYCDAILQEKDGSICEIEWLDIYPNPTAGKFSIESKFLSDEIKILNLAGEVLYRSTLNAEKTEIDISNLPAGVYFVITKGKIGKVVKN